MKLFNYAISLLTLNLYANELPIITSLNEDMSQTTQLATQKNQNIDYQPFILSVWNQKDLFTFGVSNLKDALMLIPGIDLMGDSINNRTMVVRGSNPLAYGQTKMIIDGVVVNDHSFDSYNAYLNFPIEIIERIEVVRGPGSFIDGVNGYAGTINVITKAHNKTKSTANGTLFAGFGSHQSHQTGFWQTFDLEKSQLSIDGFYYKDNAKSPEIVTDKYGKTGFAPLNNEQYNLGFSLRSDNSYLLGRVNEYVYGSAFGNLNALPNDAGQQSTPSWYLESGYATSLSSDILLKIKGGIYENSWESDARSLPVGTYGPLTYPLGYWADLKLDNRQIYGNILFSFTGLSNHNITAGYTFKHEEVTNIQSITTERVDGGIILVDYSKSAPFLDADAAHRYTHEFYFGDSITINNDLELALNFGGTKTTSISTNQYQRAALVYQPHRSHIFKTMLGNSYRLPSWQELYTLNNPVRIGNPDLNPEHVTSYEAQYIYKPSSSLFLGINAFYLKNNDQITANTNSKIYENIGQRNIKGIETEFKGEYSENDSFAFSYSYITGETIKGDQTTDYLPFSSSHLLKGALSYSLTSEMKAAVTGRYASEKKRRPDDGRSPTKSFSTIDMTLGWENSAGFYVQARVKNLFNSLYYYPSTVSTYNGDYPIEGRIFWVRTGLKF
ncbi:TonB-dependent receptor [Sulfuricurvum sp.]|uniref:TonB-dependent receptor plug domain-containing protein n=1 Tax=Sulfuricurvum sp. TaxID=2025608 RepID=UPI0026137EAB|nr:TonB-dependent receptor [Sulfuricurvum sp.]MDD2781335.1 TonB-dependent receptor [Sulfuricurvum sp.]